MARDLGVDKAQAAVDECLRVSEQAIAQVREVSRDLCPSLLDELGLLAALQAYLEDQARRTGLAVNLVACSSLGKWPGELESTCFRVAQAALANAIEQASAQHVQVELRRDAEGVYLTICDDGVGVDPQAVERRTGEPQEQGLPAMRQRVELLGGTCRIEAGPGQGTKIEICLPLDGSFGETSPANQTCGDEIVGRNKQPRPLPELRSLDAG
jgi:signal transduction histidine kinase